MGTLLQDYAPLSCYAEEQVTDFTCETLNLVIIKESPLNLLNISFGCRLIKAILGLVVCFGFCNCVEGQFFFSRYQANFHFVGQVCIRVEWPIKPELIPVSDQESSALTVRPLRFQTFI